MPHEDEARIRHMIEMAEAAAQMTVGRSEEALEQDLVLRLALARALEVLGEAASRLSADTRERAPDVPWREIIGMRNRLVHAYFDIDPAIMWKTATVSAPAILPRLRALLGD
jgi:uncharacterized protein with HEPN domain